MPRLEDDRLNLPASWRKMLEALLRTHVPQAEVWAYGSRVTGGAHEASDLDIVLRNPVDSAQPLKAAAALRQALSGSMLPIMVDVHDWANLPGYFRDEISRGYVVLQDHG